MAITDLKLTTYAKDVSALSDNPNDDGLNSTQLKAVFMGAVKEEIKTNFNALIDAILATTDGNSGADNIGVTTIPGVTGNTAQTVLEGLKTVIDNVTLGEIPDGSLTNAKLGTDIKVGSLAALATTEKSDAVGAINEVNALLLNEIEKTSNYAIFKLSNNQTISNNTDTLLFLDSTVEANTELFALDDGNIKVLKDGTYEIVAYISFNANANGYRTVSIDRADGALNLRDFMRQVTNAVTTSGMTTEMQCIINTKLSANQSVKVELKQTSGGSLDILGGQLYTTKVLIRSV